MTQRNEVNESGDINPPLRSTTLSSSSVDAGNGITITQDPWVHLRRLNAQGAKNLGTPFIRVLPQSEIGKGGAELANVPDGMEAIVDIVSGRIRYVPKDYFVTAASPAAAVAASASSAAEPTNSATSAAAATDPSLGPH